VRSDGGRCTLAGSTRLSRRRVSTHSQSVISKEEIPATRRFVVSCARSFGPVARDSARPTGFERGPRVAGVDLPRQDCPHAGRHHDGLAGAQYGAGYDRCRVRRRGEFHAVSVGVDRPPAREAQVARARRGHAW
jgi:hypothetical protein